MIKQNKILISTNRMWKETLAKKEKYQTSGTCQTRRWGGVRGGHLPLPHLIEEPGPGAGAAHRVAEADAAPVDVGHRPVQPKEPLAGDVLRGEGLRAARRGGPLGAR